MNVLARSFFPLCLLFVSSDLEAQTRPAQCLLEVKGVHYLGGPCKFTALDKLGSLRITDIQGLNLIAQINVQVKDEGTAIWNGPLGGNANGQVLGKAYRQDACWFVSDSASDAYEDSRICAWSMNQRVYVGPSPPQPANHQILYYGGRVGMYFDIVARNGIGTTQARIITRPSRAGAITLCREYARDYSMKCIEENLGNPQQQSVVSANCSARIFTGFSSGRYAFLGRNPDNSDLMADFLIRDLETGEILDGSNASGYGVFLEIFRALCPSAVPKLPQ